MIAQAESRTGRVIVVHGISSHRLVMWPLSRKISLAGYDVDNWGYPGTFQSIEESAQLLNAHLDETATNDEESDGPIHFVTHSMGAIVVRRLIAMRGNENFGRSVFLAPPHRGTPLAHYTNPVLNWIAPPVKQLSDDDDSFVNRLPKTVPFEAGVLAARYDLFVPEANTHLDGQTQHETLSLTHNLMIVSPSVAQKVVNFLDSGDFNGLQRSRNAA